MKKYSINHDQLINDLMAVMVNSVNYEGLARNIVEFFANFFEANLCTLWRHIRKNSQDKLELSASIGIERNPGDIIPTYVLDWNAASNEQIIGITPWIAIRKQICIANSYYELKNDSTKPWYGAHRGRWDVFQFKGNTEELFKCLLGLPIIYKKNKQEKVIGVIKVENTRRTSGFIPKDKKMAQRLMPFVAIALETMSVREIHEQKRQQVLRSLAKALLKQKQTEFYQEAVNKTAELLKADICTLWLVNEERSKLTLGANFGVKKKEEIPEYPLNWDIDKDKDIDGLTPWIAIRKRSFFADKHEDLENHPAWRGKWDKIQWNGDVAAKFGCLYAVPLLDIDEKVFGVLKIENKLDKSKFDAVDRATFDLVADFIPIAIELNSRLRSDIVFDFFHLLKQPVANAITVFRNLRDEISRQEPRKDRIESRLEMMSKSLETVRIWAMNVYGLATATAAHVEKDSPISIFELFSDVIKEMQSLFPEFTCNLDKVEDISLLLTPLQIKKVNAILFNILDNSFKYSKKPRNIWVESQKKAKEIYITINDNGRGIAPEYLPLVSDPFFTKPAKEWTAGMGLGLATVDRLIKELGWQQKIESRVNKGTKFSIIIPKEALE